MDAIALPLQVAAQKHGVGIVYAMLESLLYAHAINTEHTQHGFFLKAYFRHHSEEEVNKVKAKQMLEYQAAAKQKTEFEAQKQVKAKQKTED